MENRVLSIMVKDHVGVVNRITALFFSRNINIESLIVCKTENKDLREIFVEIPTDVENSAYITKLLNKIIDIVEVVDLTDQIKLSRQQTLVRIKTDINTFTLGFNDIHATFLDKKGEWIYLEINDSPENTEHTIEKLQQFGEVIFVSSSSLYLK